jgi:LPXTG-motif cell wall-anchored protein
VPVSTSTTVVESTTTSTVATTVPVELIPAVSVERPEKPAEELALTGGTRHWSLGVIGFALVIAGLVMLWRQRRG